MAEVYGEKVGQGLDDETWLADAGRNHWIVLMKDDRIRYRPAELQAPVAPVDRDESARVECDARHRSVQAEHVSGPGAVPIGG